MLEAKYNLLKDIPPKAVLDHLLNTQGFSSQDFFLQFHDQEQIDESFVKDFKSLQSQDKFLFMFESAQKLAQTVLVIEQSFTEKIKELQYEKRQAMIELSQVKKDKEELHLKLVGKMKAPDFEYLNAAKSIQGGMRDYLVKKRYKEKRKEKINRNTGTKRSFDKDLMEEFASNCRKKKITPEQLFRLADAKQKDSVSCEEMEKILKKMGILTQKTQITRLCTILDEDYSGDITKTEYFKALEAYQISSEKQAKRLISHQQESIIKVLNLFDKRNLHTSELFAALDKNEDGQISLDELKDFLQGMFNSTTQDKTIQDKDFELFLNFMDLDHDNFIDKGEFLAGMRKAKSIKEKYQEAFIQQNKEQDEQTEEEIGELKRIVKQMYECGLGFSVFCQHFIQQSLKINGKSTLKLGQLIKALTEFYPKNTVDDFRLLLRNCTLIQGSYNLYELESVLMRFKPQTKQISSIYSAFNVLAHMVQLKVQEENQEGFLSLIDLEKKIDQLLAEVTNEVDIEYLDYEIYLQFMTQKFNFPLESISETYAALCLEREAVKIEDLKAVLFSFVQIYISGGQEPLFLSFIADIIPNFSQMDHKKQKTEVAKVLQAKVEEKNLKCISIFNMADSGKKNEATIAQILRAFSQLVPYISIDIIKFALAQKAEYKNGKFKIQLDLNRIITREDFSRVLVRKEIDRQYLVQIGMIKNKPENDDDNEENRKFLKPAFWLSLLDDCLKQLKKSPAAFFEEASRRQKEVANHELSYHVKEMLKESAKIQGTIQSSIQSDQSSIGQERKQHFQSLDTLLDKVTDTLKVVPEDAIMRKEKQNLQSLLNKAKLYIAQKGGQSFQAKREELIGNSRHHDSVAENIMAAIDKNQDGAISREEFEIAIKIAREEKQNEFNNTQPTSFNDSSASPDSSVQGKKKELREIKLPTKKNLEKLQTTSKTRQETGFTFLDDELQEVVLEIEKQTGVGLKSILSGLDFTPDLKIRSAEICQVLRSTPFKVHLQSVVDLFKALDKTEMPKLFYSASDLIQILVEHEIKNQKPLFFDLEMQYICKKIQTSPHISVLQFIQQELETLGLGLLEPEERLDSELCRIIVNQLFELPEIMSDVLLRTVQETQQTVFNCSVQDLVAFIDLEFKTRFPDDKLKPVETKKVIKKQEDEEGDDIEKQDQKLLKDLVVKARNCKGQTSLSNFLTLKGYPQTFTSLGFSDLLNLFSENEKQSLKILNAEECKNLFLLLLQMNQKRSGRREVINIADPERNLKRSKLEAVHFVNFLMQVEGNVVSEEVKNFVKFMENAKPISQILPKGCELCLEGRVNKQYLIDFLTKSYGAEFKDKVIFIVNFLDKEALGYLKVVNIQKFLVLYSKSRQISMDLQMRYFALRLDFDSKKVDGEVLTVSALKCEREMQKIANSQIEIPVRELVFNKLQAYYREISLDILQDFTELLSKDAGYSNHLLSLLIYKIDRLRTTLSPKNKFTFKIQQAEKGKGDGETARSQVIRHMRLVRPKYAIHNILNGLNFSEQGFIPSKTLKKHIKSLYQIEGKQSSLVDSTSIDLLVALMDRNNDEKLEINEVLYFFDNLYEKEGTLYKYTVKNLFKQLGALLYQVNCSLDKFYQKYEMFNEVNRYRQDEKKLKMLQYTFNDFCAQLASGFRLSKYEATKLYMALKTKLQQKVYYLTFEEELKKAIEAARQIDEQNRVEEDLFLQNVRQRKDKILIQFQLKEPLPLYQKIKEKQPVKLEMELFKREEVKEEMSNQEIYKYFVAYFDEIVSEEKLHKTCQGLKQILQYNFFPFQEIEQKEVSQMWKALRSFSSMFTQNHSVLLSILSLWKIPTYEIELVDFKNLILCLKDDAFTDYEMLEKILLDRKIEIEDFLIRTAPASLESIIAKISKQKNQVKRVMFKERDTFNNVIAYLEKTFTTIMFSQKEKSILKHEWKPKEFLSYEVVDFFTLKLFFAQCEIPCQMLKAQQNFIFSSEKEAILAVESYKKLTYTQDPESLESPLILVEGEVHWLQENQIEEEKDLYCSKAHNNVLFMEVVLSMDCQKHNGEEAIGMMVPEECNQKIPKEFIIVKLGLKYVLMQKKLPYGVLRNGETIPLFSYQAPYWQIPYIEKAIAIFLGSYHKISEQTTIRQFFSLMRSDIQIEDYTINQENFEQSYKELREAPSDTTWYYMFRNRKSPIEAYTGDIAKFGHFCSIVDLIEIDTEKTKACLAVVYNPLRKGDSRTAATKFSKGYYNREEKNKVDLDYISENYGQELLDLLKEEGNNVFTYEFKDIFKQCDACDPSIRIIKRQEDSTVNTYRAEEENKENIPQQANLEIANQSMSSSGSQPKNTSQKQEDMNFSTDNLPDKIPQALKTPSVMEIPKSQNQLALRAKQSSMPQKAEEDEVKEEQKQPVLGALPSFSPEGQLGLQAMPSSLPKKTQLEPATSSLPLQAPGLQKAVSSMPGKGVNAESKPALEPMQSKPIFNQLELPDLSKNVSANFRGNLQPKKEEKKEEKKFGGFKSGLLGFGKKQEEPAMADDVIEEDIDEEFERDEEI